MINTPSPLRIEYSVFHILYKAVTKCTHIKETAAAAVVLAEEGVIAADARDAQDAAAAQTVPLAAVAQAASIHTATAADTLMCRCAYTTARDTHKVTHCSL
jgi:hypothetical protein